ncbi:MAG: DUF1990 domain-containing protein [Acidimicrobiia bacterium]|nr:DUF1990 domain-containing protein [Acidimicrobiia bacterium]
MYHLRRPSAAVLASLVSQQSAEALSYPEVGISLGPSSSPGHHRLRAVRAVGSGEATFAAARQAIDGWFGHARAGATLQPPRPPIEADRTLALALRVGPLWVTAACRIVAVVDEEHRYGFAYGTLPHHPAQGEESFLAVRDPGTGGVQLEITASSRPRAVLARLGGPVGRWLQQSMAERYLDGFASAIHRSTR